MSSVNKAILIGNIGANPEVRSLESGIKTASFSMATSRKYKDKEGNYKESTQWHRVVAFRSLAEIIEKYIKKGSKIYIEGEIRYREYTDKEGIKRYITEIFADQMQMLDAKKDSIVSEFQNEPAVPPATTMPEDDLPF
jgi:single-strand DNA-binding protein